MKIVLDDNGKHLVFAPLTLTRPVGDLRIGIFTCTERWKMFSDKIEVGFITEQYLSAKFRSLTDAIICNSAVIPDLPLLNAIENLPDNAVLSQNGNWIAKHGDCSISCEYVDSEIIILENRWELFQKNGSVLKNDFEIIRNGRKSQKLSSSNTIIGDSSLVFLEDGAKVEAAILNTTGGPIYIGRNAEVMEGSIVRGPFAMKEDSALKMGAKIYGPTTLGPHCKVGGEVNNCIFQAYSNKGHDGFLGNSLIGEWCNLGADTNTSNLKNNYGKVRTYSYVNSSEVQTDEQFMGLTMGDHSKCGINTMFNTASVVGVSSNVFGADFPNKFISSFQWGTNGERYDIKRAFVSSNNMMNRRGTELSPSEIEILQYISDKY